MSKVLIRVDFSSSIGFGHKKRIERFLKRENIQDYIIVSKEAASDDVLHIKSEEEFFTLIQKIQPDTIIIDNYNFTYEHEKHIKELFPYIKLICFDDMFELHYCDEVINHNLYAKKHLYKGLPDFTKIRIIPPLIGEEFIKARRKAVKKEGIFVSLGATDAQGVGLALLKALKPKKPLLHFYTTSANAHLDQLKKFVFLNRWVKLHIDEDVALGMARARFAIITPSVISYEALFMKIPFVAIEVVDNQYFLRKYLEKKRIKIVAKGKIKKISRFIPY